MYPMSNACSQYGASIGRTSFEVPEGKCRLFRVKIDSGGYDDGGAYWGIGAPLYCLQDENGNEWFVRSGDRMEAREHFESKFQGVTFSRR